MQFQFLRIVKILSCFSISDTLERRKEGRKEGRERREGDKEGRKKGRKGGGREGKNPLDSAVKCITSPFVNEDLWQHV